MKRNKLFRFLSVLLVLTLVFSVGCSSEKKLTELPEEVGNKAGGNLSEYISAEFESEYSDYYYAEKIEDVIERKGNLIVTKTEDKDLYNNVVETYSVFNIELDRVVLTVENKCEDIYSTEDKFGNEYMRSNETEIKLRQQRDIAYIEVKTSNYVKIDDALVEDYEDHDFSDVDGFDRYQGDGYEKVVKYDYYDARGTAILSSDFKCYAEGESKGDYTKLNFGRTAALFENKTGALVETWDTIEENKIGVYDVRNELYGYIIKANYGLYGALEVYALDDSSLVYRYPYMSYSSGEGTVVLANGDVLIQDVSIKLVDINDTSMSSADAMDLDMDIKTFILHPDTATLNAVETEYIFSDVKTKAELLSDDNKLYSDKVLNMGVISKKAEWSFTSGPREEKVVFFNSNLEITAEVVSFFPEQTAIDGVNWLESNVKALATGDYLVEVKSAVGSTQAIIKATGELRCYVPQGAVVLERAIAMDSGVYDFDLDLLMDINEDDSFAGTIGNSIIISRSESYYEEGSSEPSYRNVSYLVTEEYYTSNEDSSYYYGNYYNELYGTEHEDFFIGKHVNGTEIDIGLYSYEGNMLIDLSSEKCYIEQYGDNYLVYDGTDYYKVTTKWNN